MIAVLPLQQESSVKESPMPLTLSPVFARLNLLPLAL